MRFSSAIVSALNLYLVNFKFSHHGKFAGYDHLVDFFPGATTVSGQNYEALLSWIAKQKKPVRFVLSRLIGRKRHWIEYYLLMRTPNKGNTVIHFLYAENQFRNFGRLKGRRKLVCTFHQPPSFFQGSTKAISNAVSFGRIDAAIVVSSIQKPALSKLIDGEIQVVHHGVDRAFFQPSKIPVPDRQFDVLMIGNWLRDFDFARTVFLKLYNNRSSVQICVVANKNNLEIFSDLDFVTCKSGIADNELLSTYQNSRLLFLPLKEATANNAAIEGLSCGLPIVTLDVPGIRDYLTDDDSLIVEPKVEIALAGILSLLDDTDLWETMAANALRNAENFAWERIARRTMSVYESLVARDGLPES